MKRMISLLLALCLLLCACGAQEEAAAPTETTAPPTTAATEPPTEATEPPTEETEPAPVIRHPLTGEQLDAVYTGRPTAVVINNLDRAMPQYGISFADFFYEVETESGVTRCLAIFTDLSEAGAVGPIRSARTFFNNISISYNIPIFHCGGSPMAKRGQYNSSSDTISGWEHVDEMAHPSYFYRDYDRYNSGYAWEHTLFSTGEDITQALADLELNTITETGTDYGLQFDEISGIVGETANTIIVTFRGSKTTTLTYNATSGLYEAQQYGDPWIDGENGNTMAFRNVFTLYETHEKISDGKNTRSFYDLIGEGEGIFACDGQIVKILWSRPSLREPFSYTLEDGTPITLGVGTSYVAIVSDKCPVSYE